MEKVKKDERTKNWCFILYPESAPTDWRSRIDEQHIQWIESPLHENDFDPTGTLKKAHHHILLLYDGNKSYEQIKTITDELNCPIPQKVASAKGLVRYMLHLDNPEKYQYSKVGIIGHGGADIEGYLLPPASYRYQFIKEMLEFVVENNIVEMQDMLSYAMNVRQDDWFPLLCDNSAYIVECMIRSRRHSAR